MSGGALNYIYYQIRSDMKQRLLSPGLRLRAQTEGDSEVKEKLLQIAKVMQECSKLAKEAEWYLSGDVGFDTFSSRVEKIFEGS